MRVLGAGQAGGVVAPQGLVLVPVGMQVHAPLRVHVACGGGVVAVGQVVLIGVQTAEDVLGIGVGKAVEEAADLALCGVGLGSDQVLGLNLGLHVEGQACVGKQVLVPALFHKAGFGAADAVAL